MCKTNKQRPPFHRTETLHSKTTERPKIGKVFQQSPRSVKIAVSVEWLRKPLKDHWKTKNNFSSKIHVGPWRQLKVYWETNKTIERSLKDHLAYCQRSLKDQSRSLKDWPRPLKELWKTDQDPRENSERLTETAARILKERDNRDCRKIMERLIRPLKVHWEIAERLLKDHFPERPLKDCFEPFQKVLETTETTKTTERSARNRERPRRSLKVHWKTIERSSKFHGLSAVFQRSCSLWNGGLNKQTSEKEKNEQRSEKYPGCRVFMTFFNWLVIICEWIVTVQWDLNYGWYCMRTYSCFVSYRNILQEASGSSWPFSVLSEN